MPYDIEIRKPKTKFSACIASDAYKKLINESLSDPKTAQRFIAEITTLVSNNPTLQECDPKTIYSAGMLATSMKLPLAPALGFCHIIPFLNTKKDENGKLYKIYEATFQIGWKGLVQLAIRTSKYEDIGVRVVHEGEVVGQSEFGDDIIKFSHENDMKPIIGYYAYFKLKSGFKKTIYWTKEQCELHGKRYSPEYRKNGSGKWKEMFDDMALKTVLKATIIKVGHYVD